MSDVLSPRILLISTLDDAAREMEKIGVSPGGIRAMAGKTQTVVVKIAGADIPTAHVIKQQMLSIGGDAAVAKGVLTNDVVRTDILLMGTHAQLKELSEKLSYQPFDLPALGKRIADALQAGAVRGQVVRACDHKLDLGERVHVMGILNVTPDSFSDGGLYMRPTEAVDRALAMVTEGADIVDVGGQSSRPGSHPVPEEDELARVLPVVERLCAEWNGPVSVDTTRAGVAERALAAGASIVNDISAFSGDPRMAEVTARAGAACVLMHMRGAPETMQEDPRYDDLMGEIAFGLSAALDRARAAGVGEDRMIVDPGLGFGKTTEHNLAILRHLPELRVLGKPILVGPSRKSFIGNVLDLPTEERLEGTLATAAYAVAQGARVLRVHDIAPTVRAARMVAACLSSPA